MRKVIPFYALSILVILSSLSFAGEKVYTCHRLTNEPAIDGELKNDPGWKNIPHATGFVKLGKDSLVSKQTSFMMGYTHEALYIGIECAEPEIEKLTAKFKDDEVGIYSEDSIEIFLFPQGLDNYFQLMVNTIGSRWNGIGYGRPYYSLWNWEAKVKKGKDCYYVEIRIPFDILLAIPEKNDQWTGNICRNIRTSSEGNTTWAHVRKEKGFHDPERFSKIVFIDELSMEETRETRDRIISVLKEKIRTNLESCPLSVKEASEEAKKYPSLEKEIASFTKEYEEIQKGIAQLDSIKKAHLLLKKSKSLSEPANELKGKILIQELFE